MNLLNKIDWRPTYSHEDGNLLELFFIPALSCAVRYQRISGYFSANVLSLAARGLNALIANGGKMELIVGCTLQPPEIEQINKGYQLRDVLAQKITVQLDSTANSGPVRERMSWLSWMIAYQHLDIKLAAPFHQGKFVPEAGLFHIKAGILTDAQGERLQFTGSINETEAGWLRNVEKFDVSCSWRGKYDLERIEKTVNEFEALWQDRAKSAKVVEWLELYPPVKPTAPGIAEPVIPWEPLETPPEPEIIVEPHREILFPQEKRKLAWSAIHHAPKALNGALVAVKTSAITPWPHQLRVYQRLLHKMPFQLLIADEVGLGKTIEAGLIIKHLWISETAKRICILAPKAVAKQWQSELYEKFNLLAPIYTGKEFLFPQHAFPQFPLSRPVAATDWTQQPLVIVSSHLMRRKDRQQELLEAAPWDLVVLDEAHHARRRGAGTSQEKGPNRLLHLMHQLKQKTQSLLLLTATPMQVHSVELWDLLALLGMPPDWTFMAFSEYFKQVSQNPDTDQLFRLAGLFRSTEALYGLTAAHDIQQMVTRQGISEIGAKIIMEALRDDKSKLRLNRLTSKERRGALAVLKTFTPIKYLMSRHTRDLLRRYYQAGLLDTPIAERKVEDITIIMTDAEHQLYTAVENYISSTYQAASSDQKNAVGFVMTIYRRRLASSFCALRRTLEKRLQRMDSTYALLEDEDRILEDLPQDERADEVISEEEAAEMEADTLNLEEKGVIMELLASIAQLDTDTKALNLVEQLNTELAAGYDSAIIFTQYTDTMDFLREFLSQQTDLSIGCYSGSGGLKQDSSGNWQNCGKEEIKKQVRNGAIKLLICTDAAGEGLNLQFCGVLINYDLPWNPMKVEQRIGRIDRIGQKYAAIRVINLAYQDTIEADIYFTLSQRINLFHGLVGKLQPILSNLPKAFEAVALAPAAHREHARLKMLADVERRSREEQPEAFSIDDISDEDLTIPQFPDPPYLPEDLAELLINEEMLPPGFECSQLDTHTFSLSVPGKTERMRITTSPAVFDEHVDNHQLLSPDSPIYRRFIEALGISVLFR